MSLDFITNNKNIMFQIQNNVNSIMKDGKIDIDDIPEIIFIISYAISSLNTNLTDEDLSILIKNLFNLIIKDDTTKYNKIIDSTIKLVLLKINTKKICSFFSCFNCRKNNNKSQKQEIIPEKQDKSQKQETIPEKEKTIPEKEETIPEKEEIKLVCVVENVVEKVVEKVVENITNVNNEIKVELV